MTRHYKLLYDGRIEDVRFLVEQKYDFLWLLRRNPGDVRFKDTLDNIEKALKMELKDYKREYWHDLDLMEIW